MVKLELSGQRTHGRSAYKVMRRYLLRVTIAIKPIKSPVSGDNATIFVSARYFPSTCLMDVSIMAFFS